MLSSASLPQRFPFRVTVLSERRFPSAPHPAALLTSCPTAALNTLTLTVLMRDACAHFRPQRWNLQLLHQVQYEKIYDPECSIYSFMRPFWTWCSAEREGDLAQRATFTCSTGVRSEWETSQRQRGVKNPLHFNSKSILRRYRIRLENLACQSESLHLQYPSVKKPTKGGHHTRTD